MTSSGQTNFAKSTNTLSLEEKGLLNDQTLPAGIKSPNYKLPQARIASLVLKCKYSRVDTHQWHGKRKNIISNGLVRRSNPGHLPDVAVWLLIT